MKSKTIKIRFTNKRPHAEGLYFTPEGELIQAAKIEGRWSISDFPYAHCTSSWDPKTDKRSTIAFELN